MIKRVTAILLAVFLIFALSIPVFAESLVTIPVSGAWHFNDTLDFSSFSSNLTETVNFLSDGVPYTSMLVTSSSLSYSRSAGSVMVYGDDSVALYTPNASRTNYVIIEYLDITYPNRESSYKILWYDSSVTSVSVDLNYNGTSSSTYKMSGSCSSSVSEFASVEDALAAIKSNTTSYENSYPVSMGRIEVTSSGTYTFNNSVPYSSVSVSVPNQVKCINPNTSKSWSIVSRTNNSVNKISDNEVIKVIGQEDDSSGGSASFADPSYKTIQFGNTPQEVSAEFYSWLIRNASPVVSSIEDANGDGYDDESYAAGEQAGYTVGYADGQASSDSYDLGYSIGYSDGYNVGKDFSQNQESDSDTVSNFFVRFLGAVTSFLLYLGINISYRGVTILTILFFVIIAVLVYFLIRKLGGKD